MREERPVRKNPRLKGYDYTRAGAYFITICSHNREPLFCTVDVGQGLCSCQFSLTVIGQIMDEEISGLSIRYPDTTIDNYVIMPNHIHMIITIEGERQVGRQEEAVTPARQEGAVSPARHVPRGISAIKH